MQAIVRLFLLLVISSLVTGYKLPHNDPGNTLDDSDYGYGYGSSIHFGGSGNGRGLDGDGGSGSGGGIISGSGAWFGTIYYFDAPFNGENDPGSA